MEANLTRILIQGDFCWLREFRSREFMCALNPTRMAATPPSSRSVEPVHLRFSQHQCTGLAVLLLASIEVDYKSWAKSARFAKARQTWYFKSLYSYLYKMDKSKVLETLEHLPNEFSTDELIDRLLFIDKVERGLKDVDEGKIIGLGEAKKRMSKKWSK